MKQPMRRRGRGPCQDPLEVVLVMLHRSTIWFRCHPRDSRADLRRSGQLPTVPAVATGAAAYLHSIYTVAAGGSRATTAVHSSGVPVLQLWKGCALCQGLPLAKVGQLTSYLTSRGARREAQHRGLVVPTTPPWRRYPRERKFLRVCSSSMNALSLYCLFLGIT
jgi:hypothetical protein